MFTLRDHGFSKLCALYDYAFLMRKALSERLDKDTVYDVFKENQFYFRAMCPEPSDDIDNEAVCMVCMCIANTVRNDYQDLIIKDINNHSLADYLPLLIQILRYLRDNGVKRIVFLFDSYFTEALKVALAGGWTVTGNSFYKANEESMKDKEYEGVVLEYKWK